MVSKPHGGKLVNVGKLSPESFGQKGLSIEVDSRTSINLLLIKTGVFSPLVSFNTREDYDSILREQRMGNGIPWSIPIILDVDPEKFRVSEGDTIILRRDGHYLAEMYVDDMWEFNKGEFSDRIFGTGDIRHPGVAKMQEMGSMILSGKVMGISDQDMPFKEYFLPPEQTRKLFQSRSWKTIAAFQTRNIPHLGHEYLQKSALNMVDGLFINPVIGRKKAGDFSDKIIVGAYDRVLKSYYPAERVLFSVLHYEMYYAGPREAVMHAIMRKNFGCTHLIIGRDHAGVGDYYPPYAAWKNLEAFDDLGIEIIPFEEAVYCTACKWITTVKCCPHGEDMRIRFSASMIREKLQKRLDIPIEIMRGDEVEWIRGQEDIFVT
ncbi:MAG: sulfate adenylyltransferase [Candidatus Thermoplasmatota archaeon]|nr:sulfate adenylyltransferase [Candidatus Thermoplasmatota archaeon]